MMTSVSNSFHIWVLKCVPQLCGENGMRYKCKQVLVTLCLCGKLLEVKEMVLHQIHCPLLPIIRILNKKVDSLQQWIKVKGTEPYMSTILCWHIKTGRDVCLRFHSKVE